MIPFSIFSKCRLQRGAAAGDQVISSKEDGTEEQVSKNEITHEPIHQSVLAVKGERISIDQEQSIQGLWTTQSSASQPNGEIGEDEEEEGSANGEA